MALLTLPGFQCGVEVPDIRTEVVARDSFAAEPAFAQVGDGAFSAACPHFVHVEFQASIRFSGSLLVDAAAQHHAKDAAVPGGSFLPVESDNGDSDDNSKNHRNREVGIDEVHDPNFLVAPDPAGHPLYGHIRVIIIVD